MKVVCKAPCRVDLAGGTLDIWPLYLYHPGAVTVNFAVDRYTWCSLETRAGESIELRSRDLGVSESYPSMEALSKATRYKHPLAALAVRFFAPQTGFVLETHSEAPAGAGISGSSALMIAVSAALNRLTNSGYGLEKIREIAQNIEAQMIRVPTGVQDYYPAMYGGVSAIELGPAGIRRSSIPVDPDELNGRFVLAYTGAPRNSGINNWEVTKAYIDGHKQVQRNFDQIASIAIEMRSALTGGNWAEAGRLLREEWGHRRKNAPSITTPLIDDLIQRTRRAGAVGAKVCGAGGGGCVLILVEPDAKARVSEIVAKAGATVLPVRVARRGLTVRSTDS
jgi:D-glycero-alpha-D-manno-heptose-7-phosphate kinase